MVDNEATLWLYLEAHARRQVVGNACHALCGEQPLCPCLPPQPHLEPRGGVWPAHASDVAGSEHVGNWPYANAALPKRYAFKVALYLQRHAIGDRNTTSHCR